jgi:hypothetical protein
MSKERMSIYLPSGIIKRLEEEATKTNTPSSKIIEQALCARLPDKVERSVFIDFILRPGKPDPTPSYQNGGRWFLEWLLLKEPSWQQHHLVMLPRCWPLSFKEREHRCGDNGGDFRSLLDHLSEQRHPLHRDEATFPADLPDPTLEEWYLVCRIFDGCCGEKIRPPNGHHWDAACTSPPIPI